MEACAIIESFHVVEYSHAGLVAVFEHNVMHQLVFQVAEEAFGTALSKQLPFRLMLCMAPWRWSAAR